jgi:carboxyl-terminal processing protease
MVKPSRPLLLITSGLVVSLLLGGGLALRVGATENSYRQAVRFAEILSLVLENYVDPVEAEGLLRGAYEGMLGGLDPNGAFLDPEEVAEWKDEKESRTAGPGMHILKLGRTIQVVSVAPDSAAAEAEVRVGDHIRSVDGRLVRDLSLTQTRRLIRGAPGTSVSLELLHPDDGFRREEVELARQSPRGRAYRLNVEQGTAVLVVHDLGRVKPEDLHAELDDVRSRGIDRLLIDLRNFVEGDPRDIDRIAGLFTGGTLLRLRDRSGRLVETVEGGDGQARWDGFLALLVNGATAGAGEALAALAKASGEGNVYGEATYGLGAEPRLYELEHGYGLLVSASLWETATGDTWNVDGVEPDQIVSAEGRDYDEARAAQLKQVLDLFEARASEEPDEHAEAA